MVKINVKNFSSCINILIKNLYYVTNRTPVMAGACFSIDKKNFEKFGSYDKAMTGIGSENIEISFRVSIC